MRDAGLRYNEEGVNGLFERRKGHRPEWLSEGEQASLAAVIFRGPKPEVDGFFTWTREALAIWISAHFGKTIHPSSLRRVLRRLELSRQKTRPVHPKHDDKALERIKKRITRRLEPGCGDPSRQAVEPIWFQDEARVEQKGRLCHRWWIKGQRPPGLCDQRFDWTYIFAAAQPISGEAFALVLPEVSTRTMTLFLAELSKTLAEGEHAVMVLDGAGWHASKALNIPGNITLVPLPPMPRNLIRSSESGSSCASGSSPSPSGPTNRLSLRHAVSPGTPSSKKTDA